MDIDELKRIAKEHLIIVKSVPLGDAKPPNTPEVYAVFFEQEQVYIDVARGKKALRNRKRNYVGGDERHTTHRQFLSKYPEKLKRTAFIKENVSMAWYETETASIAEAMELQLIALFQPIWNWIGKSAQ